MKTVLKYVQPLMTFLVPLVGLLIHGCALPHLDPDVYDRRCSDMSMGLSCLVDFEASPAARNAVKEHSIIRFIHYRPRLHVTILEPGEDISDNKIAIPEPLNPLKERFFETLQEEVEPSNFHMAQDPHPTDRLGYFKQLFGNGLVLDIRSAQWILFRDSDWTAVTKIGSGHYGLIYTVRVRLIRAEGPTLLWQKLCRSKHFRTEQKYTLEEWQANDNLLLKRNAEEEAKKCADDLAASLLGK
ncbi:MAG: hypothetical protein HC938_12415 [Nitrospira sp.]|nr:hypothetical protein [Nitrospira sp.]